MRFKILGSSSSGNAALLITENCKVLIDAGFSARRLGELLEDCGESIDEIDAVFLTHEHNDHAAGVKGLARKHNLDFFANESTARTVQSRLTRKAAWKVFETGTRFEYRDLSIETFPLPHDAYEPVGFVISHGGEDLFSPRSSLAWVLDLGYIPEVVKQSIRTVDTLVIEANHDLGMLQADPRRPWSLKQRISGRHGHLSNDAVRALLMEEPHAAWKHVYLAHLSRDCNSAESVMQTFAEVGNGNGDRSFYVVDPVAGCPMADL